MLGPTIPPKASLAALFTGCFQINAGIIAIKIEKDGIAIATPFGGIAASGGVVVAWGPGGSPK
jgi:hypothetical protein